MAAEGVSNRAIAQALFVTLRTVETHLSRTYSKLGIRSRTELAHAFSTGDRRRPDEARGDQLRRALPERADLSANRLR
jgi:regulatory LuxR family protein